MYKPPPLIEAELFRIVKPDILKDSISRIRKPPPDDGLVLFSSRTLLNVGKDPTRNIPPPPPSLIELVVELFLIITFKTTGLQSVLTAMPPPPR